MPESRKLLKGQKALVTGANSGIGKGIAIALAHAGADVVVNYHAGDDAAEWVVEEAARCSSRVFAHQGRRLAGGEVRAMFERMYDEFGTIDILVNNAGLQQDAPLEEMTLDQWNRVISRQSHRAIFSVPARRCANSSVAACGRKISCAAGKIICISSVHEVIPWAGHVNYAASKGGVMLLMKSIAQEVAPYRIRVNSICPGAIRTPINREAWATPEAYDELLEVDPLQAHRRGRRHRPRGHVARFGPGGLRPRREHLRRRRDDALSRL